MRLPREEQEGFELRAEEVRARRVVEGERGQRVHHAPLAHVAAVVGFDADDRNDDLLRHAVLGLGASKRAGVLGGESHAVRDMALVDEDRPVVAPRANPWRGGRADCLEDLGLARGEGEQRMQFTLAESVALDHFADEFAHFLPARIPPLGCPRLAERGERLGACQEREENNQEMPHAGWNSFTERLSSAKSASCRTAP